MERPLTPQNNPENNTEYFPRKDEIRSVLEEHCKEYEEKRELSDEKGIYLWEVEKKGAAGDSVVYTYQRKGAFSDIIVSAATILEVAYYQGTELVFGEVVAEYNPQTKTWKNK